MKILIIGGTGTISTEVTKRLIESGEDVFLLNRGNRVCTELRITAAGNVTNIIANIQDEKDVRNKLAGMRFDCVCQFIGFTIEDAQRDFRLFKDKTKQYLYISSASVYHKPVASYKITEGTTLANPFWEYSRNKIRCEEFLMEQYRENGFPVTLVRPSHTYDERSVPLGVHGKNGSWQVLKRMIEGKPVIIHGDGTSLWTMTHSADFAKGFCGLLGNPHAIGEAFHITSDESLTWDQIYHAIANALNVELKAVHVPSELLAAVSDYDLRGSLIGDKACSVVFDNSKIKSAVPSFRATISFADGIRKTVENVLSHPGLQKTDEEFDLFCDKVIAGLEEFSKKF